MTTRKDKFASSIFLFLTISIMLCLPTLLLGQDVSRAVVKLPFTPDQLSQFDWKKGTGIMDHVRDWADYAGKKEYIGRTVLKKQSFPLLNTNFVAEFRMIDNKQTYEILFKPSPYELSREQLTDFRRVVNENFGKPIMTIDLSHASNENETIEIISDWIFGGSRVRLDCFGMKFLGRWINGFCSLMITDRNILEDLRKPIYLKLTGQQHPVGYGDESKSGQIDPLLFIVDLNRARILRRDYSFLCDLKNITNDLLVGEWHDDNMDSELRIDRRLGVFFWKLRFKDDKSKGVDIKGTYEVLESIPSVKF